MFIVIFLFAMGAFTFYVGRFYDNGIADLSVFFAYHPWLYLFLVPALAMRLWAEERRTGTMELLLTLPVPLWATVVGKYLAAWAFTGLALALTFPIWLTVNYLGNPDNGVILASYIGSFLMAGGYLAIGACISATTSNQVIAFVVTVVVCFLFTISGAPLVLDFVPRLGAADAGDGDLVVQLPDPFPGRSRPASIDLRDMIFFFSLIALFLFANVVDRRPEEERLSR